MKVNYDVISMEEIISIIEGNVETLKNIGG